MPSPKKRSKTEKKAPRVVRPRGERVVASPVVADVPKGAPRPEDRRDAMLLFVMDVEKRPVSWLHKEHFPHLFFKTIEQWHNRDGWAEKRKTFWEKVDAALFKDFQTRITRSRMAELEKLEAFSNTLAENVGKGEEVTVTVDGKEITLPIVPKHFNTRDSAMKLILAIDERIDAKRNAIMDTLPIVGASSAAPPASPVHLTLGEGRAMAHALLREKQKQLEGGVPSEEEDDPVPEETEGDE